MYWVGPFQAGHLGGDPYIVIKAWIQHLALYQARRIQAGHLGGRGGVWNTIYTLETWCSWVQPLHTGWGLRTISGSRNFRACWLFKWPLCGGSILWTLPEGWRPQSIWPGHCEQTSTCINHTVSHCSLILLHFTLHALSQQCLPSKYGQHLPTCARRKFITASPVIVNTVVKYRPTRTQEARPVTSVRWYTQPRFFVPFVASHIKEWQAALGGKARATCNFITGCLLIHTNQCPRS